KHRQHPRSALHPAPDRVGTGQMTLQVSNSVFAATDQMKGNMIDLDSRFVSHYQHTEAVVIYVLQEPVLVFLAEVFGDVHLICAPGQAVRLGNGQAIKAMTTAPTPSTVHYEQTPASGNSPRQRGH